MNLLILEASDILKEEGYDGKPRAYVFDPRPHVERADEEKELIRFLWEEFRENFPNLVCLELHVPALVYLEDEIFLDSVLSRKGWTVNRGKDIAVKDYRRIEELTPQVDVAFLDQTFVRNDIN